MSIQKQRNFAYDNFRAFLIVCVVVGHLLETMTYERSFDKHIQGYMYFLIYSFHMPAFLFLSGMFTRFSWKKVSRLLILYLSFQIIYTVFIRCLLGDALILQFKKPYWILWYLVVLIYYTMLTPILDKVPQRFRGILPLLLVIPALLIGYCDSVGYDYSLSRFVVYAPFFVWGYYSDKNYSLNKRNKILAVVLLLITIAVTIRLYWVGKITKFMLYGSYAYSRMAYGPSVRLQIMLMGFSWIFVLRTIFLWMFRREIPLITYVGKNTLSVFLLHGFICKLMDKWELLGDHLLLMLAAAVLIIALCGNKYVKKVFDIVFFPRKEK